MRFGQSCIRHTGKRSVGNILVAVETGNFFGNICKMFKIIAERRYDYRIALNLYVDSFKNCSLVVSTDVNTDEAVDPFGQERKRSLQFIRLIAVNDAVYHITGVKKLNQFKRTHQSRHAVLRIELFFISSRSFGTKSELLRSNSC